jgi:hypothetical protein
MLPETMLKEATRELNSIAGNAEAIVEAAPAEDQARLRVNFEGMALRCQQIITASGGEVERQIIWRTPIYAAQVVVLQALVDNAVTVNAASDAIDYSTLGV